VDDHDTAGAGALDQSPGAADDAVPGDLLGKPGPGELASWMSDVILEVQDRMAVFDACIVFVLLIVHPRR
jgi:hypothetical protein